MWIVHALLLAAPPDDSITLPLRNSTLAHDMIEDLMRWAALADADGAVVLIIKCVLCCVQRIV